MGRLICLTADSSHSSPYFVGFYKLNLLSQLDQPPSIKLYAITSLRLGGLWSDRSGPTISTWPASFINLCAFISSRLESLWSNQSAWPTYPTISTWPTSTYKPLCSHKLKVGELVVQSVYLTNLPYNRWRPTLIRVIPPPLLLNSNPYKVQYPSEATKWSELYRAKGFDEQQIYS